MGPDPAAARTTPLRVGKGGTTPPRVVRSDPVLIDDALHGRGGRADVSERPPDDEPALATDLVEYLIVAVPDTASLGAVAAALAELADAGTVRILDVVVATRRGEQAVEILDADDVADVAALRPLLAGSRLRLSERDAALAGAALPADSAGLIVLTEDRWATSLSLAARRAGGRILAGDRIPQGRVEEALVDAGDDSEEVDG
jgi:hypothetical protein